MNKIKVEKKWKSNGLKCVVAIMPQGHRCGYVGIDKNNVLNGVGYMDKTKYLIDKTTTEEEKKNGTDIVSPDCFFDVHGGVTYSGDLKHILPDDKLWWFGYDCSHYQDAPIPEYTPQFMKEMNLKYPTNGIVRSLNYCITECESLAKQLANYTEH